MDENSTVRYLTGGFLKILRRKELNLRRNVNKKRKQNEDTIRMRFDTCNKIQKCHKVKTGFQGQQRVMIVRAKI